MIPRKPLARERGRTPWSAIFVTKAKAPDREVVRDRAATGPRPIPNGLIERTHPKLAVGAQCRLRPISGSSFHSAPQGESAMTLDRMLLIDKQVLETPLYGVLQMTWHLRKSERPLPQWARASPKTAMT